MSDFATLGMDVDSRGLTKGQRELRNLERQAGRTEKGVTKASALMSRGLVAVGAAAAAALGGAQLVRSVSKFEEGMSRVGAISRASAQDLEAMREVARDLGSTTEFSATQAADGLGFLAMAGFNARESIAALPQVLDLATASGLGLAQSADIASNVISGFGLAAEDAAVVADTLAAASSRANTDVGQLGQAMSTVAPIAASLDISVQDTAAAIGVLSDAGIQGARAGTAMRGVLASLAGPTGQARAAIESYGLAVEDVDPATNSLAEIMGRFEEVGLSAADAMTIFGREAASGGLALIDASDRVGDLAGELNAAEGAAGDMADTMRDNLGGDIKGLMSALEGLLLSLGEAGLTAVLRGAVQAFTALARFMSENVVPAFKVAATVMAGFAASTIPATITALTTYTTAAGIATTATGVFTTATRVARAAVAALGGPLGVVYAILGSVAAGMILFKDEAEAATPHLDAAAKAQDALNAALGTFSDTAAPNAAAEAINLASEMAQEAKQAMDAAKAQIALAEARQAALASSIDTARTQGLRQRADEQAAAARERLAAAESALAEAERARDQVAREVTGGSITLPNVNVDGEASDRIDDLSGSVDDLMASMGGADGSGGAAGAAGAMADGMDDATKTGKTLADKLNGQVKSAVGSVADAFGDFVARGFQDFKGFARSVIDTFKNMLSQMISMAVRNRIMIGLGFGGGAGGATSALAGGGGGGGLLSSVLGGGGGSGGGLGGMISGAVGTLGSAAAGTVGTGFLGAAGNALGIGMSSFSPFAIGANAAMAGGGALATIGAALPAIGLVAGAISLFIPRVKELDRGIRVTADGLETSVEQFRKIEKSRLFGLIKSRSTNYKMASDAVADPIRDALGKIQGDVMEAARVMGTGASAFQDFSAKFKLSLKGMSEEERLEAVNKELAKMGDEFASLVPGFSDMNSLLQSANAALQETFGLGRTRFEAEMLVAARRRGEITTTAPGPGASRPEDLIRLQSLDNTIKASDEKAEENNRILLRLLRIWEGFEIDGVPRGPVVE